jgi:hypothetical protein
VEFSLTRSYKVKIFVAFIIAIIASTAADKLRSAETAGNMREPAPVIRAYLRAVYARDFAEAYRYVSSEDRRIRDLDRYLRQRGPFSGFALRAARILAAMVEVEITPTQIAENRRLLTARYKAPDPEKLSALLLGWNGYRLNSLSPTEQKQIIEAIEGKKRDRTIDMITGEEKLTLIKQSDGWRIYFNWAAGVTIPFRTIVAEPAAAATIDVSLSRKQVVTQPGELFEIVLKIRNRSNQPVIASVGHIVEPKELADYLEFVQCGFLLPLRLQPGLEQEYSGTYLLRGSLPEGVRELSLSYDFRLNAAK